MSVDETAYAYLRKAGLNRTVALALLADPTLSAGGGGGSVDLSDYTTHEELAAAIAAIPAGGSGSAVPSGDAEWTALVLQNGWTARTESAWATPGYRKLSSGEVVLRGLLHNGPTNAVVCTLPAGYRPSNDLLLPTLSGTGGSDVAAYLIMHSDGTLLVEGGATGNQYLALDGLRFFAEQ